MKTALAVISLFILNTARGQEVKWFQHRFNLAANPNLRNERFNSGIITSGNPYYYAGIGTSYNNSALLPPDNTSDRLRFTRMDQLGNVLNNFGYHFLIDGKELNSSGNSIAEINGGGYMAVGAVTDNVNTGAQAAGGSDILITHLTAAGAVVAATKTDLAGGSDTPWYIIKSNVMVGGMPTWLICGESKRGAGYTDCFVARVDINGALIWLNRYNFDPGGAPFTAAHCIAKQLCEGANGFIYVVGTLQDANGTDALAFKLGPGGAVQWANTYTWGPDEEFQAIRLAPNGDLIIGGFTTEGGAYNMQFTQLNPAGNILFQSILQAKDGNQAFPSKCYDILIAAGQYYLAGPVVQNGVYREMMYRVGAGGAGIGWNRYNPMVYNVGFGIAYAPGADCPGIAYFSSLKDQNLPFSHGHIMKTDLLTRTCNFPEPTPPRSSESHLAKDPRSHTIRTGTSTVDLQWTRYNYADSRICRVLCDPAGDAAVPEAQQRSNEQQLNTGKPATAPHPKLVTTPNPVLNTLHIEAYSIPAGEYRIDLIDMLGRPQKRATVYNKGSLSTDLDLSSVASGVYQLSVKQGTLVLQQKIVKQ